MRFFLLVSFIFSAQAFAQRFNFVNYSLEEGLPQSQVSDICQDRYGYLWIGTETGLSRFDGINFTSFSTENGLPDNEIDKLHTDKSGNIWIATPKGISKKTADGFTTWFFSDSADVEYRVNDLIFFQDLLYLACDEGLLLFNEDTFKLITQGFEHAGQLRALANDNDSTLYCGSKNGLYTFDKIEGRTLHHAILDSINISDLEFREHELIIATYGKGVYFFNTNTQELNSPKLPLNRIRNICVTSGSVLCATKNGAIELTKDAIYHYNIGNGLIFENIRSVFIDREANLWLGTDGKGLLKLTGKSVLSYTRSDGLSSDAVMSISQDREGKFYFGTYDAGVTIWTPSGDSASAIQINSELKNSTIWITQTDHHNRCWVGSSGGIDLIENGELIENKITQQISSKVRSILHVHDSLTYVGGSAGVHCIQGENVKNLFPDLKLDVNKLLLHEEKIYIASTTGLFIFNLSDESKYEFISLPENNVKTITTDSLGNIWIGTNSSGLFVLLPTGKILQFELDANDTKSRTVLGLLLSANHNIWVSTLNGVYQIVFDQETSSAFNIFHFGRPEGLITLECNQNAIYEDHHHFIWVGTSEGLVRINPSQNDELFHFRRPELVFTGIRLFMEKFDYNQYETALDERSGIPTTITLPYNKNHLTFDFIGINLKDPKGVKYQYRLLGAEEDWSPITSNNYATYSFITHGEYDFEVRATNASGEWSEINRMHVIITAPFWRTWWFISLSILCGLIILWAIYNARIRSIEQRQENEKLGIKNRLLFLEQQSLNASMNRHFIFNSLNSIQYFINSSNKLAANKYLTSFAKLIRKNLDSSQADNFIVTLKEEIERIELYLSLEKMRFEGKFEYEIDLDEDIDAESIEIPSMILQPFVENSIIHGVLPINRKGQIKLRIYLEFDSLVFEVTDDGIGIDNSLAQKKARKSDDTHESMGMEITNRRIELLRKLTGENLMIIGPFQVNNESGECLGTKVIIKIHLDNQEKN